MLGRLRKTTRLDVGLVLVFSGIAYLVWCLVAGASRDMVREMIRATTVNHSIRDLPSFTRTINIFFVEMGFIIDLVGLAWLILSLVLVVYSGRQKLSVSWAWLSALLQASVAALGGVMVGWGMNLPYRGQVVPGAGQKISELGKVSELSLPVILILAILLWVTCLVWLLIERAHFKARGPTLRDGLRTHS